MDKTRLEKLKQLLEITNDGLTKSEFLETFKKVFNQVLQIETKVLEKVNKAISDLKGQNNASLDALKADFKRVSDDLGNMVAKALKEQENGLNFIRDKVRRLENGRDGTDGVDGQPGKDADEERIIDEVYKKIIIPKIDETRLKAIEEELKELRRTKRLGSGGGGFSKIHMESKFKDDETPTGTVNGVNKVFTLAGIPNPPASLKVYNDGQRMSGGGVDYTLSGKTITYVNAPLTDTIILCDYRT